VTISVGAVAVVWRDGKFLLIQRGKEPNRGRWAFPGGSVLPREPVVEAARRELFEETGVRGDDPRLLSVIDLISPPDFVGPDYHFLLVPVLFRWCSGEGVAADDAEAVRWCDLDEMRTLSAVPTLWSVAEEALRLLGQGR